jgi:hypothetical protein
MKKIYKFPEPSKPPTPKAFYPRKPMMNIGMVPKSSNHLFNNFSHEEFKTSKL